MMDGKRKGRKKREWKELRGREEIEGMENYFSGSGLDS